MVIDSSNQLGWGAEPSNRESSSSSNSSKSTPKQEPPKPNQWGETPGGGTGTSAPGAIDKPGEATQKLISIGGGASTTQVEQRFASEGVAKGQVASGLLTAEEVVGGKKLLESKTAQFAPEQRQRLYGQVVYREPTVKPATEYYPDVKQETTKVAIANEIRAKAGMPTYSGIPKPIEKQLNISSTLAGQNIGAGLGYYPSQKGSPAYVKELKTSSDWWDKQSASIRAASLITVGTIDINIAGTYLGAKLFGTSESEKGYKADIYKTLDIGVKQSKLERLKTGITKIGTGTSAQTAAMMVGGGAGIGIAAGTARAVGISEKAISIGAKALDIGFKGSIGIELGGKVIQGNPGTALAEAGLIGITLPAGIMGTKAVSGIKYKEFIKSETARSEIGDVWSKIPTARAIAAAKGEQLTRKIQFGKIFKEPTSTGVTIQSGKQSLISITEPLNVKSIEAKSISRGGYVSEYALKDVRTLDERMVSIARQKAQSKTVPELKFVAPTISKQTQKSISISPQIQKTKLISPQKTKQSQSQTQILLNPLKSIQIQPLRMPTLQRSVDLSSTLQIQSQKSPQISKSITPQLSIQTLKVPTVSVSKAITGSVSIPIFKPQIKPLAVPKYKKESPVSGAMKIKNPFITLKDI
jgi:hypothetical protein